MALVKATLEIQGQSNSKVTVQFNPQSLRVNYRATGTTGTQRAASGPEGSGSNLQRTGYTSGLSMELHFDTSASGEDVRLITLKIAEMIQISGQNTAPVVQFSWGTFLFIGTIDSMDETLDFFTDQGVPVRASVNLSMSAHERDRIEPGGSGAGSGAGAGAGLSAGLSAGVSAGFSAGVSAGFSAGVSAGAGLSAGVAVGTTPLTLAQSGDTLQSLSARAGADWKAVASANNIDNPRLIEPGTVLNLNAKAEIR